MNIPEPSPLELRLAEIGMDLDDMDDLHCSALYLNQAEDELCRGADARLDLVRSWLGYASNGIGRAFANLDRLES